MLSKRIPDDDAVLSPAYARRALRRPIPRYEMPDEPMNPGDAYRLIHDELALDGNPELNLATFVTTWMDEEADRLMTETANKNAIDWDEYPQTVELQDRCVNMLARLFHAPNAGSSSDGRGADAGSGRGGAAEEAAVGTATVGSSEAIHLAGLAMKWRWRKAREANRLDQGSPNIVMGANVQVCWEKFARYFDVEPRYVPLTDDRFVIGVPEAMALVDERTIGVVGILGSTYTGEYEPIAQLDQALDARCAELGIDVPIHVDAASGGFVAPFLHPRLEWDFRLGRVHSINVSGHKYGLVYPGVGWVVWRSAQNLPQELVFTVDYLGGSHANFGLNFSRGAAQIVAQYYSLIRLGKQGYREVMEALADTARFIAAGLEAIGPLQLVGRGTDLPVVCCRVDPGEPFDVFALSDELRRRGWIVPAYRMAPDAEDVAVLRVVVREGLSMDMATQLVKDVDAAITRLRSAPDSVQHGAEPILHRGQDGTTARPPGAPAAGGRRGRPQAPARTAKKTAGIC